MPSPEDRISAGFSDDTPWIADEPAEVSQNTDALVIPEQQTEELLQFSSNETDQVTDTSGSHAAQTQTGMRPFLSPETPLPQGVWSIVAQLREENVHLHQQLTEQGQQLQQLIDDYNTLRTEHERTITTIHDGHQQDLEHYQTHLKEAIEERNRLQETCIHLEHNYQQLYHSFQDVVEEEVQKRLTEAAYTLQTSPDTAPPILQDAMRIFEKRTRQLEEKSLVETLFLKQELRSLTTQLRAERQQLEQERQNLLAMHHTACEQVELHQKTAKARLHARWRVASLSIAVGLLTLFVIMQFVFLYIFHAALTPSVSFALLAPIVLCVTLAFTFSRPASMVKHMYLSAPHKKKVEK